VPGGAAVGGAANPATPGLSQRTAGDPIDTENGDFTESGTDFSIPTYGPALTFSRSYDGAVAQQQTKTGTSGPMGYGWTDNWASSVTTTQPQAGNHLHDRRPWHQQRQRRARPAVRGVRPAGQRDRRIGQRLLRRRQRQPDPGDPRH